MDSNLIWASTLVIEPDELRASFSLRTPSLISLVSIWFSKHGYMYGGHVLIILPFLTKSRPQHRFCLKSILHNMRTNEVFKIIGMDNVVRKNMTICPGLYHVLSYRRVVITNVSLRKVTIWRRFWKSDQHKKLLIVMSPFKPSRVS